MEKIFDLNWFRKKLKDMPDYVKQAEAADLSNLADEDFALIIETPEGKKRKFPINTPANATLSQEYFNDTHKNLSFTERVIAATNIKRALEKFGLNPSEIVNLYTDETLSGNKFVSSRSVLGYLLEYGGAKLFPYSDISDIEKYLQAYEEIVKELNAEERAVFDKNLKEVVQKLGLKVPANVEAKLFPEKVKTSISKIAQIWPRLSPEQKLKLLQKHAIKKRLNLDKLSTAISLRESLAGEHPAYISKLNEIRKLIDGNNILGALQALMAYDEMVSPSTSVIDDLLEDIRDQVTMNPLAEALVAHLPELSRHIDPDLLNELLLNPEEVFGEMPVVRGIVMRIIRHG